MQLRFTKRPGGRSDLVVTDRPGPAVALRDHTAGPHLPHDLVHVVVERALGITDGFCGALAAGATFAGFVPADAPPAATRHRRSGLKVLRRKGDRVLEAELRVNWSYRVWEGRSTDAAAGVGRPPLDDHEVRTAVAAIEEAARRWAATAEGDTLVEDW